MKKMDRCENFARRLVEARQMHGMKAKDVAKFIGVTVGTMSRFENGMSTPNAIQMRKLAEILPVNLNWLVSGRGPRIIRERVEGGEVPFEIMKDVLPGEGTILVPGGEVADMVYQVMSSWMEPRIMEGDYIFVDCDTPSVDDLVAFRHQSMRVMVGWLREVDGEGRRIIEAEKPQNGFVAESECSILGRVVSSVRVAHYR